MRPFDPNSSSLFDAAGVLVCAAWIAVTAAYVYRNEIDVSSPESGGEGRVALREGTSWMLLRRNERDIGFVHRTRTRLESGWLTEYRAVLVLGILQTTIPLQARVKARLDAEARLVEFDATLRPANRSIEIQGDVTGRTLTLVYQSGTRPEQETLQLDRAPRLASNSTRELLARENLQPGDSIQNEYFDPTSMGLRPITLVYRGRETIDVLGSSHRSIHVTQEVAGTTLDVYLDRQGRVLLQEFPLEIIGVRVDPDLGRARSASLRNRARKARNASADGTVETAIGTFLEMLGLPSRRTVSDERGAAPAHPGSPDVSRTDAGIADPHDPDTPSTPR